jgi:hypothetical protein
LTLPICLNGRIIPVGAECKLLAAENAVAWDDGDKVPDTVLYLVEFEHFDPAIGNVKVWIIDSQLLVPPETKRLSLLSLAHLDA